MTPSIRKNMADPDGLPPLERRRGRPKSNNPRKYTITLTLTRSAMEKLHRLAERRRDNSASGWLNDYLTKREYNLRVDERRLKKLQAEFEEYKQRFIKEQEGFKKV